MWYRNFASSVFEIIELPKIIVKYELPGDLEIYRVFSNKLSSRKFFPGNWEASSNDYESGNCQPKSRYSSQSHSSQNAPRWRFAKTLFSRLFGSPHQEVFSSRPNLTQEKPVTRICFKISDSYLAQISKSLAQTWTQTKKSLHTRNCVHNLLWA